MQQYVEIVNPNDFAVDVSGWSVTGDIAITLVPGKHMHLGQAWCITNAAIEPLIAIVCKALTAAALDLQQCMALRKVLDY